MDKIYTAIGGNLSLKYCKESGLFRILLENINSDSDVDKDQVIFMNSADLNHLTKLIKMWVDEFNKSGKYEELVWR